MNYTKIKIGGKNRGIQFGMGALVIYCDLMDCGVDGLDLIMDPKSPLWAKATCALIYAGLRNYKDPKEGYIHYDFMEVQSWMDTIDQAEFNKALQAFNDSKYLGKTLGEYADETMNEGDEKKS